MKLLNTYYAKYRSKLLPVVFIFAGFIIFMQVALPNISSITVLSQQVKNSEQDIVDLKESVRFLTSINERELDSQVSLVTQALPPGKDASQIYSALALVSATSGMGLNGFSVNVGDVFSKRTSAKPIAGGGVPSLSVNVEVVNVTKESLSAFANELVTAFPVNQIAAVQVAGGSGTIKVNFFYKPYDLNLINQNNITPLTPAETKTLQTLEQNSAR